MRRSPSAFDLIALLTCKSQAKNSKQKHQLTKQDTSNPPPRRPVPLRLCFDLGPRPRQPCLLHAHFARQSCHTGVSTACRTSPYKQGTRVPKAWLTKSARQHQTPPVPPRELLGIMWPSFTVANQASRTLPRGRRSSESIYELSPPLLASIHQPAERKAEAKTNRRSEDHKGALTLG